MTGLVLLTGATSFVGRQVLRALHKPGLYNSYWMTTVVLHPGLGIGKDMLIPRLKSRGIDTRPFFHPLSSIPAFRGTPEAAVARGRNKTAYAISAVSVNLPSALSLSQEDISQACAALRQVSLP